MLGFDELSDYGDNQQHTIHSISRFAEIPDNSVHQLTIMYH